MSSSPALDETATGSPPEEFDPEEAPVLAGVVSHVVGIACIVLLAGITLTVLLQVFMRYVLDSPLTWAEEVTRIQLVWLAFLGAVLAYRVGGDIAVDALQGMAQNRGMTWLSQGSFLFVQAAIAAVAVFFVVSGWDLVESTSSSTTPALRAPMSVFYLPVVVSGGLLLLSGAERLFRYASARRD